MTLVQAEAALRLPESKILEDPFDDLLMVFSLLDIWGRSTGPLSYRVRLLSQSLGDVFPDYLLMDSVACFTAMSTTGSGGIAWRS